MRRTATAFLVGPFALARQAPVTAGLIVFLAVLLTAATQIGGLVLWLCVPGFAWAGRRISGRALRACFNVAIFAAAYLAASLAATPLAELFGRTPLPCGWVAGKTFAPRTMLTCMANRHYVALPAKQALQQVNARISSGNKGLRIVYLDAGFPFFDWFPMLPHLSHGNGRQVDLALIYEGRADSPSPIGYWGFVQPRAGDPRPCPGQAALLRWDMAWLQSLLPDVKLDERRTAGLVQALAGSPAVSRIFLEPHLGRRLGLKYPKVRFQGCAAARHDDHIHVEFAAD